MGLLQRGCITAVAAVAMAGCALETFQPSATSVARFKSDLGVGSYTFHVDRDYNGSQSKQTYYEVRRVVEIEGDYVVTRRVARADGQRMVRQDYRALKDKAVLQQVRQWNIPIPDDLRMGSNPIHVYRKARAAMLAADPAARYYVLCNSTRLEHVYSKAAITEKGELQMYRSWWNVSGDEPKLLQLDDYIEALTPPMQPNAQDCTDNGDWRSGFDKQAPRADKNACRWEEYLAR